LAVQLAMVDTAKRDSEFVADLAAEGARLHETEMMRIAGLPTAHQTRQGRDEVEVFFVADPPRPLWYRESATSSARILCRVRSVSGPVRSPGSGGSVIRFMLLLGQSAIRCCLLMADAGGAHRCAWFGLWVRYHISTQLCTYRSW
jgi:hypothetical protein